MDYLAFEEGVSSKGIRVLVKNAYCPRCQWFPKGVVLVRAAIYAGCRLDPEGLELLAHLLEHIIFEATGKYPDPKQLRDMLESYTGSSWNAYNMHDTMCIVGKTLKEMLPALMELLSEMIFHPIFSDTTIANELKIVVGEYWQDYESQRMARLHRQAYRDIYFDHCFARMANLAGNPRAFDRVKKSDLQDFHAKYYTKANVTLLFIGDIILDEALRLADVFAEGAPDGEPTPVPPLITEWPAPPSDRRERILSARKKFGLREAPQSRVTIRRVIPKQRPQHIWLLHGYLIRLLEPIREKLAATYGAKVEIQSFLDHHLLAIDLRIKPDLYRDVRDYLEEVFSGFGEGSRKFEAQFARTLSKCQLDRQLMEMSLKDVAQMAMYDLDSQCDEQGRRRVIPLAESAPITDATTYENMRSLIARELALPLLHWVIVNP